MRSFESFLLAYLTDPLILNPLFPSSRRSCTVANDTRSTFLLGRSRFGSWRVTPGEKVPEKARTSRPCAPASSSATARAWARDGPWRDSASRTSHGDGISMSGSGERSWRSTNRAASCHLAHNILIILTSNFSKCLVGPLRGRQARPSRPRTRRLRQGPLPQPGQAPVR